MSEKILFLDACDGGPEVSRTKRLYGRFIDTYTEGRDVEVSRMDLCTAGLLPMTRRETEERAALARAGDTDGPLFAIPRAVRDSDMLVIAAPYWDLSFPSVLKVFFERATACGVVFRYDERGIPVGMCSAGSFAYVTTAGGYIGQRDHGFEYVRDLLGMYGIHRGISICAEGLDIIGNDVDAIMSEAGSRAVAAAAELRKANSII
jgi:FMN-dependent NADH-azoreductase